MVLTIGRAGGVGVPLLCVMIVCGGAWHSADRFARHRCASSTWYRPLRSPPRAPYSHHQPCWRDMHRHACVRWSTRDAKGRALPGLKHFAEAVQCVRRLTEQYASRQGARTTLPPPAGVDPLAAACTSSYDARYSYPGTRRRAAQPCMVGAVRPRSSATLTPSHIHVHRHVPIDFAARLGGAAVGRRMPLRNLSGQRERCCAQASSCTARAAAGLFQGTG
eukprot:scaffold7885_cov403-Prasinococcus_capsulatus_cf.AAC.6